MTEPDPQPADTLTPQNTSLETRPTQTQPVSEARQSRRALHVELAEQLADVTQRLALVEGENQALAGLLRIERSRTAIFTDLLEGHADARRLVQRAENVNLAALRALKGQEAAILGIDAETGRPLEPAPAALSAPVSRQERRRGDRGSK